MSRSAKVFACVCLAVFGFSSTATAAIPLIEGEDVTLDLGGYASALQGLTHIPYETLGLFPEFSGLNSAIFRLEWQGSATEHVSYQVHNRVYWSLTNADAGTGGLVGLGATKPPPRTFNLKSVIVDDDGLYFEHDIDRLVVNVFTPYGDVSVGRQAITWGVSSMFAVADVWTQFSPFELDTSQKRGVDSVRWISYPIEDLELDVVVTDRGQADLQSFGAKASWTSGMSDQYFAVAKSFRRVWAFMGGALDMDHFRPYAEVGLPLDLDLNELALPKGTIGTDYLSTDYSLSFEYHFNGYGTSDSTEYISKGSSAEFQRGEVYFMGQHYAGVAASYRPIETLVLVLGSSVNLVDPSALIYPMVQYEMTQDAVLKFGGYVSLGDSPEFTLPPQLGSEYGAYGNLYFMELSAYF